MLEEILRLPHLSLFYLTSDTFFIYLYFFFKKRGNLYTSSINNYKLKIKIHIINEVHVNK